MRVTLDGPGQVQAVGGCGQAAMQGAEADIALGALQCCPHGSLRATTTTASRARVIAAPTTRHDETGSQQAAKSYTACKLTLCACYPSAANTSTSLADTSPV